MIRPGASSAVPVAAMLAVLVLLTRPATPAAAASSSQAAPAVASPDQVVDSTHPGAHLRVYVLTMGQGDAIWERFGHNAIRIVDDRSGTDVAWNWGTFDFDQADFLPRLIRGTMLYWLAGWPTEAALQEYARADRPVWSQELDLTPEQKWTIRETIRVHALPENRHYRYDYYRDNCSTRVRDVLDRGLGGILRQATEDVGTGTTWRWHTRRLLRDAPLAYAGIQLALGVRADREITEWDEMFLPMRLQAHLRDVVLEGPDGEPRPLVSREVQVLDTERAPTPARAPFRLPWFVLLGLLLAGLLVLAAGRARRGAPGGRLAFGLMAGGWAVLSGAAGALLVGAWAFTDHVFWAWNENLLQADPLALPLAPVMVAVAWRGHAGRWAPTWAAVVAGLSALGFLLQALPGMDQVNGEIIALALPVHVALAWSTRWLVPEPRDRDDRAAAAAGARRVAA